ncbi:hypothetical protein DFH08DRAFT_1043514 [Mycena albidolilacea]|uniref:Uncharacterized protein n=1 Tax=Mycena albidolilacea TaxID=1033008 RepID=A0AAD7F0B0_9AGAR|nr:hypothetical protein DFH08DRAFT_1043514 [Mycena albidolilacea]
MLLLPVGKLYIVSQACEAMCYGCFLCIFIVSVYTHLKVSRRTTHTNILFTVAFVMFIVATSHFVITLYRIVYLLDNDTKEDGSQKSLGNATSWQAIARDIIYMTQCILGDSVAIYRCWILWDRDFRVVILPLCLLSASIVSGTIVCERLSTLTSYTGIFDPSVRDWIATFHAVALGQNTITTGLMAFRLWLVDRRSKAYNVGRSLFFATMLLLVESAALYFALQIVILVAFLSKSNLQIIILGSIPPVVGITFTLLTIRAAFLSKSRAEGSAESQTIGSIQMRDLGINIQISEEVVVKADSNDSPV